MKRPAPRSPQPTQAPERVSAQAVAALRPPQHGLRRASSSLRQRNFRLFWFGQMVSLIGTAMQGIGQVWLVLELTHSPLQLGLVGALQSLGVLLFSLFGGVLADRWPKRRILLFTQSASMAQAFCLWALIASGTIQLWQLYLLALALGMTNSLYLPARQAFIVELVGREDLPNAVALNSSLTNLTRIVGPALGGIIIAASGVRLLFLLNALSYLAVIAALALINRRELHAQPRAEAGVRANLWQSLREGFAYVWTTPTVCLLIAIVGLVLLFGSNFSVLLPLFATDVLHRGPTGFGFLSAALSVGALLAALWLAWGNRLPTIRSVLTGALVFAVVEASFAISRSYPLSLALIAGVGFVETSFTTQAITMLQSIVPDHLRGRVMSVCVLFFDGSVPLGYLLVGWLSDRSGAPTALLICAALSLMVAGVGWLWRRLALKGAAEPTRA